MGVGEGKSKAARLLQLEALLADRPRGLRRAEIALRLGISKSTAGRYVTDLEGVVPLVEEDDGRLWIDRSRYLPPVRLSAHEIESMRLAYRLFARKIRLPFPHAAASLRKLAMAAQQASPHLSRRLWETASSLDCRSFPRFTRRYREVLETLISAGAEHWAVRLRHLSLRRRTTEEYLFHCYCIEPYPDGNSIHAIGFCPEIGEIRTFKVERIKSVRVTRDRFEPPAAFDIEEYTSRAWGIWHNDKAAPKTITVLFSAAVAERVRETVWHATQVLEDRPDGSILFRAVVAEPLEMYPWIRGWGADAEILEPAELRERFRAEVARMARLYGVISPVAESATEDE